MLALTLGVLLIAVFAMLYAQGRRHTHRTREAQAELCKEAINELEADGSLPADTYLDLFHLIETRDAQYLPKLRAALAERYILHTHYVDFSDIERQQGKAAADAFRIAAHDIKHATRGRLVVRSRRINPTFGSEAPSPT
jgi:hypothetical protein